MGWYKNSITKLRQRESRLLLACSFMQIWQGNPEDNTSLWSAKRLGNKQRDSRNIAELKKLGWKILVIWECQLKDLAKLKDKIISFLSK